MQIILNVPHDEIPNSPLTVTCTAAGRLNGEAGSDAEEHDAAAGRGNRIGNYRVPEPDLWNISGKSRRCCWRNGEAFGYESTGADCMDEGFKRNLKSGKKSILGTCRMARMLSSLKRKVKYGWSTLC